MSARQPQRVGDGAETAETDANWRASRRMRLRHPLGQPILAVARWNEPRHETEERRTRRVEPEVIAHVAAGVAPGARMRVNPGNRSAAPDSACMPAPVI